MHGQRAAVKAVRRAEGRVKGSDEAEINRRANEKARRRKEIRDRKLATKTRDKGLLIVHTGLGKGKSTAAFGLVLRALGHGMRVGIVQFVKGKWQSGEREALERFGDQIALRCMGEGFTWETQDRARDQRAARAAWDTALEMIEACRATPPRYDLILLDELNIALGYQHLPSDEVVAALRDRPPALHVVVTGRNARRPLIEAADTVIEMKKHKHHFDAGVRAQRGVEY